MILSFNLCFSIMFVYVNGLLLGLSLIIALGPQNIFLIKQGILKNHAFLCMMICFFCDLILIGASTTGLHQLLLIHPFLQLWMMIFGSIFLLYYAIKSLKNLFSFPKQKTDDTITPEPQTKTQIIFIALGFSLFNPHAIIDTLIIIGGGSSVYPNQQLNFLLGAATSSFLWFGAVTFTAQYFSDLLTRTTIWKGIELISGVLMILIGVKLSSECWALLLH